MIFQSIITLHQLHKLIFVELSISILNSVLTVITEYLIGTIGSSGDVVRTGPDGLTR
jgi:hypothetical protein